MRFALNHIAAPKMPLPAFLAMARRLGITDVEIRNDLPDDVGTVPPRELAQMAGEAGVRILTINGLYPFNLWSDDLDSRAKRLADYAAEAEIGALVMCPLNDGRKVEHSHVVDALDRLRPILKSRAIMGYVEPLGFPRSSLRRKDEAIAAITEAGGFEHFALVHDSFHHQLAGEDKLYPHRTALVHVSGVTDPNIPVEALEDEHRELIDSRDLLNNLGQIQALLADGYGGPISFEPFSPRTHALPNIEMALAESMSFLRRALDENG